MSTDTDAALPEGYALRVGPPGIQDYLHLRTASGLTPKRPDQAEAAVAGGWYAVHVVHEADGRTVAMGRVLGDGGWYFHVVDVAVLPEHQRRGLGDAVLTALLAHVRAAAPPGAYVTLFADPPGRRLYERHGFRETAPGSVAMAVVD